MAVIENIRKNGFLLVCVSALLLSAGTAVAMPSKIEQSEVRPLVNELMRPYVQNLKARKMTPVEVGDRAMKFVAEAKTEAAKFVLLKGAVYYYTLARRYDKSAGAIVAIMELAPDIPPKELYEITSKAAANATGGTASRLIALNNEAKKRLAVAKRLVEVEKSLKKTPDDTDLLRLHAEVVAATGDWESALKEFAKLGGETGRMAGGDSNAGYSNSQMADFWWNYAPMEIEAKDIIRRHAAALYRKAIKNNELEGLKKAIAERRIQEAGLLNRQNGAPEPRVRAASSNDPANVQKSVVEKRIEEVLGMPNEDDKRVETAPVVARKTGDVKTITLPGGATMEMIYVAPGSFVMGSPESEEGRGGDETQHRVTLTKGFWLGKYEVTQTQWESVMGNNPSRFKGDDLPVENVSWNDCQEFIRKVNARLNCGARLPTEAEWEYACRAGTTGAYVGSNLSAMGWYWNNSNSGGERKPHPVGLKRPNPWGFYDMQGNVREWCNDWFGDYPSGSVTDPKGASSGTARVLRGGSVFVGFRECRPAERTSFRPDLGYSHLGFRLCCSEEVLGNHNGRHNRSVFSPVIARKTGDVKTIALPGGETMKMIYVAPGSFMMGSPRSEDGREDDETQHRVTLTKGFWLGKYEVTQKQWKSVMGNNPSQFKGDDLPVENVSWNDCQEFICKINEQLNCRARLPTEAEWEYACRAGTRSVYPWGNVLNGDRANCNGEHPCGTTVKGRNRHRTLIVGSYQPNAWGFYDMHGNVYEWCNDWYGTYPYGSVIDPVGAASGDTRIMRGGCWSFEARYCRSAKRGQRAPGFRSWDFGLRLCCSAE